MKRNKIILGILILSIIILILSGCGGGNPVIPPNDDQSPNDEVGQEYVVQEESFAVDTEQGGTYILDDGTEVKIEPGDLISNTTLVIKKLKLDLPEKQVGMTFTPKFLYDLGVLPGGGILGSIDLIVPMGIYQQVYDEGGEIIGLRYADGTFVEVESETLIEGEIKKVKLTVKEMGTFMLYRNPKYATEKWLTMLNDLVSDTSKAKDYYEDGNCTQLEKMYQQALMEEQQAYNDLEDGVTKEDAIEIFNKLKTFRFYYDKVIGHYFWPYAVYCAFTGTGEVLSYVNVYFEAQEKVDTYNAKYGKLVIIEDLYKSACDVGNNPPIISSLTANPSSVDINQTTSITCTASDEDVGDTLTYTWTKNGGTFEGSTSGSTITWKAPSTKGNYTVTCEVSDGEASDSDQVIISVGEPTTLPAPYVTASDGTYNNKVALSCNSVTGATHYQFYRATSSTGSKTTLSSWQTDRAYSDFDASPAVTYYYFVRAATSSSGDNASPYSTYDTGWKALIPPQNVSATDGLYTNQVRITWNSVPGASYYRVYRAASSTGTKTALGSWQTGTTYYDTTVNPGTTYYYFVTAAINSSGDRESIYSTENTGYASTVYGSITVTAVDSNNNPVSGNDWGFVLFKNGSYVKEVGGQTHTYTFTNLSAGTYKIDVYDYATYKNSKDNIILGDGESKSVKITVQ